MINNRQIAICAAGSRKATHWPQLTLHLSEFYDKLKVPARGTESLAEYLRYTKPKQDDLKDVGGFVAGTLQGGHRKANAVTGRDVLTLDIDHVAAGGTDDVLRRVDGLGCGYAVYSTRKHSPDAPRLRVLLPLDRTVTADEYEPIARKAAQLIGIDLCDPTTFEASRLMYWPSCCADSQYVFASGDKPFLAADGMLGMYGDWRNVQEWPLVPGSQDIHKHLAAKQGDPAAKTGVVGAFCRTYDIYAAIDKFLPGAYTPTDVPDRYTFIGGSTTGGAVIYDKGAFLFSHHATDPCSGRLVNAFDLVRLHLYAEKDDDAKPATPTNKLPSYTAACELAVADESVAALLRKERYDSATSDFTGVQADNADAPGNWMAKLKTSTEGRVAKTTDNLLIILENDPLIRGKIAYNEFANRGVARGPLPWDPKQARRPWTDNDDAGARWYLERVYDITGKDKISDGLALYAHKNAFDDVKDYLAPLVWDGVPRLDTLLIDYLGAADNAYTRAVTRKAFTAAVARVMVPGTKFDTMTILTGHQGIGKSTLLKKMGRGWFSDSIKTFEGKEASELVQGVWLVEIGELEAFARSEIGRIKQFLSQCEDIYRAAYGRHVGWYPRRCVFFGTSNNGEYLRDKTGNRRFWPVDLAQQPTKNVFRDLDEEVDQLWAEAGMRWKLGEPLYLNKDIEKTAQEEQENHRERSPREGLVIDFVERQVPEDWVKWPLERRRMFWANGMQMEGVTLIERDKVCALEVWCEAFNSEAKYMKYLDAVEINGAIQQIEGWKRTGRAARFGYAGAQRGYEKIV